MCKEGRCFGLGQEMGFLSEGGEKCLKYLKKGWNRKEGRGNKDFKKGGKLGQGVGAVKRGSWNSLTDYEFSYRFFHVDLFGALF